MKARVKATGKLLEKVIPIMSVDSKVVMFHEYGTENDYYYYEDLDFSNTIDWEQVRIDASVKLTRALSEKMLGAGYSEKQIAKQVVELADALVAELKRSDDVYAECRRMDAINTASVCENITKIQKELQKKGGQDEDN